MGPLQPAALAALFQQGDLAPGAGKAAGFPAKKKKAGSVR